MARANFMLGNWDWSCSTCGQEVRLHSWGSYGAVKEVITDEQVLTEEKPRTWGRECVPNNVEVQW